MRLGLGTGLSVALIASAFLAVGAHAGELPSEPPLELPGDPIAPAPAPDPVAPATDPHLPRPVHQQVRPDAPDTRGCDWAASASAAPTGAVFPCDFPDPMVLRVGGTYYAYGTATRWVGLDRRFPILASSDLRSWHPAGEALDRQPAWARGEEWGPSVLAARGRYYLYYSAQRRRDGVHCLAVATAGVPTGPFRDRGIIACGDRRARGYIDAAPLMDRGRGYLYFSVDGPGHSISVLKLRPDLLRAVGPRRRMLGPARSWQADQASETVEAPWPVRRGGRFYLFYSAGCWCSDYRMGWAVARRPTGPFRLWRNNPMLRGHASLLAPGGGSVVTGPGGSSTLVFHAWTGVPDYDLGGIRTLRTAPMSWRGGVPQPQLGR